MTTNWYLMDYFLFFEKMSSHISFHFQKCLKYQKYFLIFSILIMIKLNSRIHFSMLLFWIMRLLVCQLRKNQIIIGVLNDLSKFLLIILECLEGDMDVCCRNNRRDRSFRRIIELSWNLQYCLLDSLDLSRSL